jgi:hypothetical protein
MGPGMRTLIKGLEGGNSLSSVLPHVRIQHSSLLVFSPLLSCEDLARRLSQSHTFKKDFPDSKTVRNKNFIVCKLPCLRYFVIAAQKGLRQEGL